MHYRSFIDADDYGAGEFCTRLSVTATVNAIDYYDIRVFDGEREVDRKALSARDHAKIYGLLEDARQGERKRTEADREWLHDFARTWRGA